MDFDCGGVGLWILVGSSVGFGVEKGIGLWILVQIVVFGLDSGFGLGFWILGWVVDWIWMDS